MVRDEARPRRGRFPRGCCPRLQGTAQRTRRSGVAQAPASGSSRIAVGYSGGAVAEKGLLFSLAGCVLVWLSLLCVWGGAESSVPSLPRPQVAYRKKMNDLLADKIVGASAKAIVNACPQDLPMMPALRTCV